MNQVDMITAAKAVAQRYKVVPALFCAIIEQESEWNPWLNRYEMDFEADPRYGPVVREQAHTFAAESLTKHLYETTWQTEIKNRCSSWGLLQVLGQVARERGFVAPIPSLCDIPTGLDVGCSYLNSKIEKFAGDLTRALQSWNGGENPNYATEVFAHVPKYK